MGTGSKIAFFGNPGAGKSTLLNCLMVMRHGNIQTLFKSGTSIAKGLTYRFEQQAFGDYVYMDTPGLDDIEMREQAAEGISKALKQGGMYLIVFVVRESAGKIHPSDLATIKTVLQSAPEIKSYGVIINKLSKPVHDKFSIPENSSRLQSVFENIDKSKKVSMLFLRNIPKLEDVDNEIAEILSLKTFVDRQPMNTIHVNNVGNVDQNVQNLESQIEALRLEQEKSIREFEKRKQEAEQKRQLEKQRQEQERLRIEEEARQQRAEQERRQREAVQRQQEEARRQETARIAELERQQKVERERQEAIQRQHAENLRRQQEEQQRLQRQHEQNLRNMQHHGGGGGGCPLM